MDRNVIIEEPSTGKLDVEQLIIMVLDVQREHPDWSRQQILEHVKRTMAESP